MKFDHYKKFINVALDLLLGRHLHVTLHYRHWEFNPSTVIG